MTSITVAALVVAVASAIRSTWSPCGVSMLSTLTPLAEQSRGRSYRVTAAWFVAGSVAGGLALGALAAVAALAVSALSLGTGLVLAVSVVGALVAAAVDGRLVGPALPHHRRQVNELWLDRYRSWVYGVGFGAQIGVGLATFIMTAGVYLTLVLAALIGRPLLAMAVGVVFGLVRGLAVLAAAPLTTPERLSDFHRRFEAWRAPMARWMVVIECGVAIALAVALHPVVGVLVAVIVAGVVISRVRPRSGRTAAPVDPSSVPAGPSSGPAGRDWTAAAR